MQKLMSMTGPVLNWTVRGERNSDWQRVNCPHLFTFCPPGPELLDIVTSVSSLGIVFGPRFCNHARASSSSVSLGAGVEVFREM